ncbi:DNA modification methylase [Microbacterium sp. No. 7]|uniref:hypothetical protein n=1 Tax=unclassified Microbacterium TaxID=2609290 RepID=UPI000369AAC7|nr:hypothetical protein [Microbacterium sp. 11MF]
MKSRLIASLALGAAVVLGTTGCNMLAPQATTIQYSASDGVNVPDSGPLKVRNALIIANEDGTLGNLVAAVVNSTEDDLTLNVSIDGQAQKLEVGANSSVSLGVDSAAMLFDDVGKPGADVDVSFQSGEGEGVRISVPILDGTLPYYTQFVPTPAATATPAS